MTRLHISIQSLTHFSSPFPEFPSLSFHRFKSSLDSRLFLPSPSTLSIPFIDLVFHSSFRYS